MDWLRYYTNTLESQKIQALPAPLFKAWVNVLCVARIFDGVIPPVAEVAFRLRVSDRQASVWLNELERRRLLDRNEHGETVPHDWDEHQYPSDDAAGRKRAYRAKKRGQQSRQRTGQERDAHGTSPGLEQNRADTEQNRAETELALGPPLQLRPSPRWLLDEQYAAFVKDYRGTGGAFIDTDFAEAYEFCWKTLDFEQKLQRIAALNRHAEEYHAEPRYVPKPLKFLETEWERPVKPKARESATVVRLDPVAIAKKRREEMQREGIR